MKKMVSVMEQRPHYYRGQLLLEGDFLAEQDFHVRARLRHNLHLHGWGVAHGLKVSRASARGISIAPGFALDKAGREIVVTDAVGVELTDFGPSASLEVVLSYEEVTDTESGGARRGSADCCAAIVVAEASESAKGVLLAVVSLDGKGEVAEGAIDDSAVRRVRVWAPESITAGDLHPDLKRGWLRLPFRPHPLVNIPRGEKEIPPAFRIGATECLSPDPHEAEGKDRGAAGTMSIPIPPHATHVTRMRIAGSVNEGELLINLLKGGWDPDKVEHVKEAIVEARIQGKAAGEKSAFLETFEIADTSLNPEYQTLSVWLRGTRRTALSLIAVEFVYW
ncbi:MAG: hypothetical protein MUF52_09965 [Syntrophobacteraceae bacterium]|jgi:hypothetical protein|nr:hypothetical protein [Syntrophobacteraceae bacterium]